MTHFRRLGNLIAEVGVAAGLGIKSAFEKAGKPLGKARIEILLRCGQGARDKLLPPTMKWTGPTLFK